MIEHPYSQANYSIDTATVLLLREWMQSALTVGIDRAPTPGTTPGYIAEVLSDSQWSENGPSAFMQRLAASLTTRVRDIGNDTAAGSDQIPQTYIHVRWIWFALPLAVLLLTTIFFVITVLLGAIRQVPVWGCSSLPSLVYYLDHETATAISDAGPVLSKMQKAAGRYRLAMHFDNWKLRGVRSKDG